MPRAGELLVSLAPGYECVDWGGQSHVVGGSHGALAAGDSLGPLVLCGLDTDPEPRRQWTIADVSGLVLDHFGLTPAAASDRDRDALAAAR